MAVTGWGEDRDRELALAAGFDLHITKPADPDAVARVVALGDAGAASSGA